MIEGVIGFIGAGQMARAFARGLVASKLVSPDHIFASDPEPVAISQFQVDVPGAQFAATNADLVRQANVVVLAVKPQSFAGASMDLGTSKQNEKLFISIMAGVSFTTLTSALRTKRLIRVMPNTPCLVGAGASAYALGAGASAEDCALVEQMLLASGLAVQTSEKLLDAVTGLSGSGPAYVYTVIEALSDGGVRMGLPRSIATKLAAQTVLGAAKMVLESGEHPSVLRDRVTSPAGTTSAGLQVLERAAIRSALIDAVEAATIRSQELGKQE